MTDEAYPNHHARMPPDFYLGMSDGEPVHWGGPTRECHVIDRPRWAGGRMAWRVRVVPPIPEWQRSGHQLAEWVLQERYVGQSIEELRDDNWVTVNLWRYEDPQARSKEVFDDMDLSLAYVGEVALRPDILPDRPDYAAHWQRTLTRIRRFVEAHGHSRFPEPYFDEDGRLDILVGNIRWHHAGRAGESVGPFPGVDYAADLDKLDGWSWDIEEASELPMLRSRRHQASIVRLLGLDEAVDEADYILGVTAALRKSEDPPWPWVRELVFERGVDPRTAILADLFPTRHHGGFLSVVITSEDRAFAFYLGYAGDPDVPSQWEGLLELSEWRELTTPEDQEPYEEQIEIGRQLLKHWEWP